MNPRVWVITARRFVRKMTISPTTPDACLQDVARAAGLGAPARDALQAMAQRRQLVAGQSYQLHGDAVQHAVLVVEGFLLIGISDAAGRSHILRPMGAGSFFNLLPVMDGGPAIHDAHAGPATTLLLFPKAPFLQLMERHADLHHAVHQVLYARNRLLYDELAHIALSPLRQRCARLLLQVMDAPMAGDGVLRRVRVSQTELANMLGYARAVVNRELRQLEKDGLIRLTYRCIEIPDVARLAAPDVGVAVATK